MTALSARIALTFAILLAAVFRLVAADAAPPATNLPAIFVCGDSTSKNSAKGKNGEKMVGWGTPIAEFFDPTKVVVKNVGHAGKSSLTYYNGDWPNVLPQIKSGDYVLLVFGINDGTTPPGLGDETVSKNGADEHTYGWYMSKMATDAQAQGAHVYLLTVTTRDIWTNPAVKFADGTPVGALPADYDPKLDKIERGTGNGKYTEWTKEVGQKLQIPVLDLTNLLADKYEAMGRDTVNPLYSDHNHTYAAGAKIVAESIVSGLKAFSNSPFIPLLSEEGNAVVAADPKYVIDNSAGSASPSATPSTATPAPTANAPSINAPTTNASTSTPSAPATP